MMWKVESHDDSARMYMENIKENDKARHFIHLYTEN